MTQHHRSIRLFIGLLAAPIVCMGLISAPAAAYSVPSGTVKGVVTVAGVPLAGAKVTLVRRDGDSGDAFERYKTVTTNSVGRYSLTRPRGSDTTWWYDHVVVSDPKARAVTAYREFMGNTSRTVTRNVTLKPAASITGKVTRTDGASPTSIRAEIVDGPDKDLIENLQMSRYDDDRGVSSSGTYRFPGLPAGTYTVCYRDTTSKYRTECYDEAVSGPDGGTPSGVAVKSGGATTLKAQLLDHLQAHLRGIVTDTSGRPLRKLRVAAVPVGGPLGYDQSTSTWSTGGFDLPVSTPGDAQIYIADPAGGVWESRWYDSATRTGAQVFALAEGTRVNGLAIKLKSKAKVKVHSKSGTGKVTFTVDVTRRATGKHPSGTITISRKSVSRTVTLKKGIAKITLTGLPSGKRTFHVDYRGTSSTADARRTVTAKVR